MRGNGVPAWTAALDELEQFLAALQDSVAPGDGADSVRSVPVLPLPPDLGPIPPELQVRAAGVLQRCHDFEAALQAGMVATSRELTMISRMQPQEQTTGSLYLDQAM